MRKNRFFILDEIKEGKNLILKNAELVHQIFSVLRLRKGDEVFLFNNNSQNEFSAIIESCKKDEIILSKIIKISEDKNIHAGSKNESEIFLAPTILKKDKFEWVIQKATEIGIKNFLPCISERTEKLNLNLDRLKKIAIESTEQSDQTIVPKISEINTIENILKNFSTAEKIYLDMSGDLINIKSLKSEKQILIFVGPEGGWSDSDKKIFQDYNARAFSLGPTVLRAETASLAIASLMKLG